MTRQMTHCALRTAWLSHLAVLPLVALAWAEPTGQGAGAVPPPFKHRSKFPSPAALTP